MQQSTRNRGFSALQRAENSSTDRRAADPGSITRFQCSSASRKFLNSVADRRKTFVLLFQCSSASRKFLNQFTPVPWHGKYEFQCSSASRKFLNRSPRARSSCYISRFSALQRAENSSTASAVSVCAPTSRVSVLFSEPKIPQPVALVRRAVATLRFSALQRAENSSTELSH